MAAFRNKETGVIVHLNGVAFGAWEPVNEEPKATKEPAEITEEKPAKKKSTKK